MKRKYFLALTFVSLLALGACKKSKVEPTPTPEPPVVTPPTAATRQQLTLDSLFLYAKDIYYWYDKLPTYEAFNPRQYTTLGTDKANYDKALFEIAKYSNPGEYKATSTAPKFSYITDKTNKNPAASGSINNQASVDTDGNGNDVGIRFGLYGSNSNYKIYVTAVYNKSPAETAGFVRGDVIQKINGVSYGTNFPGESAAINAALNGATIALEGTRFDGSTFNLTLTKTVFKSSHVYKSKVIDAGNKKIGYLAYARFGRLSNSASTASLADVDLDGVFNSFTSAGVTDLVIDLRYNGGGYVYAAEYLINLIAPSTATGVMFTEYYNPKMQAGNADILKNQPYLNASGGIVQFNGRNATWDDVDFSVSGNTQSFSKKGSLNGVKNIVFLVTGNSASASELTINALKPHVNVKLVGQTTYGKPIGFFPIVLENKYEVWLSSFVTKNSLGQGDYYDGLTPDVVVNTELANVTVGGVEKTNVMFDFGNPNDSFLKAALNILAPGVVVTGTLASPIATKSINSLSAPSVAIANDYTERKEFKGMIENRFKLKK